MLVAGEPANPKGGCRRGAFGQPHALQGGINRPSPQLLRLSSSLPLFQGTRAGPWSSLRATDCRKASRHSSPDGAGGGLWRLQMNGSLARKAIQMLMAQGTIRAVSKHANQVIYTRATNT